ncbi:MAG: adenosine kinase [Acidimicrobiales bacterium]
MPDRHVFDVVGIGNALVDVIVHGENDFLERNGLVKGSMTLIDKDRAVELYKAIGSGVEMSGGSAANTMCGVASFGGRGGYIGKVADDDLGTLFGHDLRAVGVAFRGPKPGDEIPTGRCLIVVTPDAERTMSTFLGMSSLLVPDDVDPDVVASGKVVYLEGYLWDRPEAMAAYRKAAAVAHDAGNKVSLTLSDSFCVDRHREAFLDLVAGEVDILFSNEDEICSLYEVDSFDDAVARVSKHVEIAAITCGAKGSIVVSRDGQVAVPAEPVDEVVDTTGAGDLYAAGFLHGLTHDRTLVDCARLGSIAASEVISHVGARPVTSLARLARAAGFR